MLPTAFAFDKDPYFMAGYRPAPVSDDPSHSTAQDAINLARNFPPLVPDVFDVEYRTAIQQIFAEASPTEIVGSHRWAGTQRDREAGAQFVSRRLSQPPSPDRIVLTNGTQSALKMLLPGLIRRGGLLAVEALSYPPLATFARRYGVSVAGVPLDEHGLSADGFENLCRLSAPNALYVVPTLQNPTTSTMPVERRLAIAGIARKYGVPIVEDDIYSLLPDAPPPLSSFAPELSWYVLGVAKSVAAGMKVAFVVAPSAEEAAKSFWPGVRGTHWMSAPVNAAVMTALVENGGADRVIDAVRSEVRTRQEQLRQAMPDIPHLTTPHSLHVWIPLPAGVSRKQVAASAKQNGLIVGTSDEFAFAGIEPPEAVRIGIGSPRTGDQLTQALATFVAVLGQQVNHSTYRQ